MHASSAHEHRAAALPDSPPTLIGAAGTAGLMRWVPISGGTCRYGDAGKPRPVPDLLVAATPLSYRHIGAGDDVAHPDLPVTGIDYVDAARLAALVGGRLPTSVEWEWIAAGPERRTFPWGDRPWTAALARLRGPGSSYHSAGPVGQHPAGTTPDGLHDLAGNVWEWTASPVLGGGYLIRGGSYAAKPLYARCTFLNAVHSGRRSPGIGVRPVKRS